MKSFFYKYVEYKIDLVDRLHQRWEADRKKNPGRSVNEADDNSEVQYQHTPPEILKQEAYQLKLKYFEFEVSAGDHILAHKTSNVREIPERDSDEESEEGQMENQKREGKPHLFESYRSYYSELPTDNPDPFFDDLIEYAKQETLAILVIGKPKCGRTTLCQSLSQRLGVELVSIEAYIEKVFAKIREVDENGGPERDEDGNPIEFLTPVQRAVIDSLQNGESVPQDLLIELINSNLSTEATAFRGFLFDFPLYDTEEKSYSWLDCLLRGDIKLPSGIVRFTHVIDLTCTDQEARHFASSIMEHPEDIKITSLYERQILRKPKPIKLDEDGNPIEEEIEEEELERLKKTDANLLVYRANESIGVIQRQLLLYSELYPTIHNYFIAGLPKSRHIEIDVSGLNPQEVLDACLAKLGNEITPLRSLTKELQPVDDGSLKDLLRQDFEEEGLPSRRWSAFWNIDPVSLSKGRVMPGKGEFPCEFAGRVFVFETEENRAEFMKNPKRFVARRPKMPKKTYTVAVVGPRMSGKNQVAEFLEKRYGWQAINVEDLVCKKLFEMKTWEQFIPSNYLVINI